MSKYTGTLDTPLVGLRRYIKKGDKNKYVGQWQNFLNWYIGENVCAIDNIYGDITFKYTVQFQTETFSAEEADGTVGKKTIAKAKAYDKQDGKKHYDGPFPSVHVTKSAKEAIEDGLHWARVMAGNNLYHYGEGGKTYSDGHYDLGKDVYNITHQSGCHFCNTNTRKKVNKIKKLKRSDLIATNWEYTYVCNTFVTAILAHGFLDSSVLGYCSKGSCVGMNTEGRATRLDSNKNFQRLGKVALDKLQPGDVLVKSSHMSMCYAPINSKKCKIVEATSYAGKYGNASSKSSIRIIDKAPTFVNVYRFVGKVDADIIMKYGECGKRVGDWQDFLNWWSDGQFYKECGGRDNFFGDNTKAWTIKFQEKEIGKGEGDGLVGNKTITRAKEIKK